MIGGEDQPKKKEGMLEVDDNFGLDDSDEDDNDDNEFMPQSNADAQMANFDNLDDDDEDDGQPDFNQQHNDGGLDNDEDDEDPDIPNDPDEDDEFGADEGYERQQFAFGNAGNENSNKNEDLNTKKVENQQFDEALDIDDSNEIESEDDDGEVDNADAAVGQAANNQVQMDNEVDQDLPGQYNAADYANLNVDADVKELFEYIGRYKPQKIELETTFKPFIPEFIPWVGEVDAFIKMSKPDGAKEDLGIQILDEPALNHIDESVLTMKYIQQKKTGKKIEMDIRNIENAEKNPKDIQNWIKNVGELHKDRPPATVQYSKIMPDFDELMAEWPAGVENVLRDIPFPGPEIDLSTEDYIRAVCMMLDIPIHKTTNNKGLIEACHVMFTLFSTFKENQHFQKQQQKDLNEERDNEEDFMKVNN